MNQSPIKERNWLFLIGQQFCCVSGKGGGGVKQERPIKPLENVTLAWLYHALVREGYQIPMQLPRINLNKSSRIRKIGFYSTTILLALEINMSSASDVYATKLLLHPYHYMCVHLCYNKYRETRLTFVSTCSRTPLQSNSHGRGSGNCPS